MRSIEEIKKDIAACQVALTDVWHEMETFEPDEKEAEDAFDEMLDECCEPFRIGYLEYSPSQVLREVDPIVYRYSVNEFVYSEPADRWSGYRELEEREEELNNELSDLEDELEEAKGAHEEGEEE